jgi:hypothetical protein
MLNFLGIGAQKAGTTWLYTMLSHHPAIRFPAGKEIHFWDQQRQRGIDWYDALFTGDEQIKGEITPAYAILSVSQVRDIYTYYPHIRLFYVLRNPIERAWSAALMALERAEMTITDASDQWFIDHFNSQDSLKRGDYEACLKIWTSVYLRSQLLILRFEAIATNPSQLLTQCCQHLGINTISIDSSSILQQKVFAGEGYPLRPTLHTKLLEMYKPKIMRLSAYLQQDFSNWLELKEPLKIAKPLLENYGYSRKNNKITKLPRLKLMIKY